MTNINSTSFLPTDPLGSTFVTIFTVIGIVFVLGGRTWLFLIAIEKIEGHFRRLWWIEERIKQLEKSSVSSETKTGE